MFYDKLTALCASKGISVTQFCRDVGLSNATATKWKKGAIPFHSSLYRVSKYFNVEIEYLLDDRYLDYEEWLNEVKRTTRAEVLHDVKWLEDERKSDAQDADPMPYEVLLPLLKQLTPEQVQRVKDFVSGMLS